MKRPADFKTKLGGRTWDIRFVTRNNPILGKNWGLCDWENRTIYVCYQTSEKAFLDTLIHECQHALSDIHYSAEEWVTQTSTELTLALLAAGVRAETHRRKKP